MKPFVTPGRPEEERQADDTERPIKAGGSVQQLRTAIHNAVSCGLEVCVEEGLIKATDAHFDLVVRRLAAEGARSFQVSLAPRRHRDGADARRVRDLPDTDVATAARRETTTAARSELATAALRDLIDSCPDGVSIAVTHVPRCMLEPRHRKHVACATESRRAWTAREGGHGGRQRARGGADSPDDLDAWSAADPPAAFSRPAACGECLSVVCCPGLPADYLGSAWEDSLRPVRVIPPDEERDYQAYMANVLGGYLQTAVGPSATRVLDAFCGYPAKNLAALKRACPLATVDLFDAKVTPNTDRFVCLDLGDADLPFVDPFDLILVAKPPLGSPGGFDGMFTKLAQASAPGGILLFICTSLTERQTLQRLCADNALGILFAEENRFYSTMELQHRHIVVAQKSTQPAAARRSDAELARKTSIS